MPSSIPGTPTTPGKPVTASIARPGRARGPGEAQSLLWSESMAVTGTGQSSVSAPRSVELAMHHGSVFHADGQCMKFYTHDAGHPQRDRGRFLGDEPLPKGNWGFGPTDGGYGPTDGSYNPTYPLPLYGTFFFLALGDALSKVH